MLRSFRFRIALLSVLISGVILAAFGVFAWGMLYRTALQQIDASMQEVAQLHLSVHYEGPHWRFLDESLKEVYGHHGNAMLIRVLGQDKRLLHESTEWPREYEAQLPQPGALGEAFSNGPGPGPGLFRGRGGRGTGRPGPPPPPGERPLPPPPGGDEALEGPFPPGEGFAPARDFPREFGPEPGDQPGQQWERGQRLRQGRGPGGDPGQPQGPPFGPGMRPEMPPPLPLRAPVFATLSGPAGPWRIGAFGNPEVTLLAAMPLGAFRRELATARNTFLLGLPLALCAIALGSWFIAGRALRPVHRLTETIGRISAKGLHHRVDEQGQAAEFAQLARMFNEMLERLQGSFEQTMRFSADAAHELKTPLTIFQGELEQALKHAPAEQRAPLARLLEEVQRLKAIIQKLLLLALADAGQLRLHREQVDLAQMLEEMVEDAQILAPNLQIESKIPERVEVAADRDLLRQALQNLVSNAVKYTERGGRVRFSLARENGQVRVTVRNQGDIPPKERIHVFDRFYRADKSRSRLVDGAGLGLSLAREIARAHQGDIRLDESPEGIVSLSLRMPAE